MSTNHNQNQIEERIKVFNINSIDLLITTIFLTTLKLEGYLDWSWLGVATPLIAWWLFGKLLVFVVGIYMNSKFK